MNLKSLTVIVLAMSMLHLSLTAQVNTNCVQRLNENEPDVTLGECLLAGLVLTAVLTGTAVIIYVHWKFKQPGQGEKAAFVLQRQDFPGAPWVNVSTNIAIVDTNLPAIAIWSETIKTNKIVEWRCKCYRILGE